jgi:hypothetical protein
MGFSGGGGGSTGTSAHTHTNAVGDGGSLDTGTLMNNTPLFSLVVAT